MWRFVTRLKVILQTPCTFTPSINKKIRLLKYVTDLVQLWVMYKISLFYLFFPPFYLRSHSLFPPSPPFLSPLSLLLISFFLPTLYLPPSLLPSLLFSFPLVFLSLFLFHSFLPSSFIFLSPCSFPSLLILTIH